MDEMAAYYNPPPPSSTSYSYYQQQPPPPQPPPSQLQPPPLQSYAPTSYAPTSYAPPPPFPPPHSYHHHQPPPYQQPPPSYLQPAPPPPQLSSYQYHDDVRTLFIAGLPEDVEARELYNLFREFPGYESTKLRRGTEHNQPYGFAVFIDPQSAVGAMQALNGLVFDLEKKSTLYISLAKSNSKSKRSREDDERSGSFDKRFKDSAAYSTGFYDTGVGSNIHMPGIGNSAYNMSGYSSTQSHGFDSGAFNGAGTKRMKSSTPYVPQNSTPCPTLFVANLGPTCAEQELVQVFSRLPGFIKLKMQNKNGAPVAFVDFQDISCSSAALNDLQDTVLYTSSGEGMRLEYAKSRMGKPKK